MKYSTWITSRTSVNALLNEPSEARGRWMKTEGADDDERVVLSPCVMKPDRQHRRERKDDAGDDEKSCVLWPRAAAEDMDEGDAG